MDLIQQQKEKFVSVKMPVSVWWSLKIIGKGSVTSLIAKMVRQYNGEVFRSEKSRDTMRVLMKLYYRYYPYACSPKFFTEDRIKNKIRLTGFYSHPEIYKIIKEKALQRLMTPNEFVLEILIQKIGEILNDDPFIHLRYLEVLERNPNARPFCWRPRPVEPPKTQVDKIRGWIRNSLKNHLKSGYTVLVTEDEVLALANKTSHCKYCGVRLRYIKSKGISKNLFAEIDREENESVLRVDNVAIICKRCNWKKGAMPHHIFVKYC